jgi:hypothetical protein
MLVQTRNSVVRNNMIYNAALGVFVRGSRSFGNRIEGNTIGGVRLKPQRMRPLLLSTIKYIFVFNGGISEARFLFSMPRNLGRAPCSNRPYARRRKARGQLWKPSKFHGATTNVIGICSKYPGAEIVKAPV